MKFERLTECEEVVMKTVWDSDEELCLMEIMDKVNKKYNREWKPQTVSTFLAKLVRKGYVAHYRQGRQFYYKILVPLKEYKGKLTNEYIKFWHHENADEFLRALMKERDLRPDEIEGIKAFIAKQNIKTT